MDRSETPTAMPAPIPPEADPAEAWRLLAEGDLTAWWSAWHVLIPAALPAEVLAPDAPRAPELPPLAAPEASGTLEALLAAAPEASGTLEAPAAGLPPDASPAAGYDLPAACNAATPTGQDGPGSQPSSVSGPGEQRAPGIGAEGTTEAALRGTDSPTPGAEVDPPAACNAAATPPGAGQDGPGGVPCLDPAGQPPDLPARPWEDSSEPAAPHDPPGQDQIPPSVAGLIALLEAELRAAYAWLDDFLAGRVEAASVFDPGLPRGHAEEGHDWSFG